MPLHVLLLNPHETPDQTGTARMFEELGAELTRLGHRVTVSTSRRWNVVGAIRRFLSPPDVDVIVCPTTPQMPGLIATLAARMRGAASILWSMEVYPDLAFALGILKRTGPMGRVLSMLARVMLGNSDRIVALGQTMRDRLLLAGAREVEVIPGWADQESTVPGSVESHPLREKWDWQRRFVILYSGAMGLAEEFETVISAANKLINDSNVLFAFVGGGPRLEEVRARVSLLALTNVEFRLDVPREELGHVLTAADVHLVTLHPDVSGLLVPSRIYEILAAGRPTLYVGPREGEIPELLHQGRCGTQVDNGETDRLTALIREYARDAQRCWQEGERARRLYQARYSSKQSLADWVRLIEQAASRTTRSGPAA